MRFGKDRRRMRLNRWLRAGYLLMIAASMSSYFVNHYHRFPQNVSDGAVGVLYGMMMGCMFVGIRKGVRDAAGTDHTSCA